MKSTLRPDVAKLPIQISWEKEGRLFRDPGGQNERKGKTADMHKKGPRFSHGAFFL